MKLIEYINRYYGSNRTAFGDAQGVSKQQVNKWLAGDWMVIDDVLLSPKRELIRTPAKAEQKPTNSLKGKTFTKTDPFTDKVLDPFNQVKVVEEKIKADGVHVVRFDDGKAAKVIEGLLLNYVEIK